MAFNLRQHIATDGLRMTIGSGFNLPVNIVFANGARQENLRAQVIYDTEEISPEDGNIVSVKKTQVTLIKADLDQQIEPGQRLHIEIPLDPAAPDTKTGFLVTEDQAPIDGQSMGWIKVFPKTVEQITP